MNALTKVNLFNSDGAVVATVEIPAMAPPGIISWRGMPFRLEQGRYVFSTVYVATDSTED